MSNDDFVSMAEAQRILGVSNYTVWRMVRDGELTAYQSSLDRRRKMIRRSDLDAVAELRPIDRRKKAAKLEGT
jgi:excisionase family DNA binding protein